MATTLRTFFRLNHRKALILLLLVIFASRVPFLGAGYGLHWDAWGNAKVARQIAETGQYTMARVPGAPVYELTIALLSWGGPWMLNGLSALASVVCVAIFALLARKYGCRDWLLAAATLGFSPVMYVNSVTSKDFTLSCALLLLSTLFVTKNRPVLAGIALGVAMGCRLTSGLMAVPLALALVHALPRDQRIKQLLWFAITSGAVVLVAFIPAFLHYGISFLRFYDPVYYPPLGVVVHRGTVDVWSALGCIGLLLACVGALVLRRQTRSIGNLPVTNAIVWGAAIILYAALYAAFPDQAGYVLPAIPLAILALARFSPRWLFQTFCVMTIAGVFVTWENGAPQAGPIFQDRSDRLRMIANVRNFYSYARTLEGRNVFVIGGFYHGISLIAPESRTGHFAYLLTPKELQNYIKDGFVIYYLPAIRRFEYDVQGVDLAQYGGIDLYAFQQAQEESKVNADSTNNAALRAR
jgi:hypothetical protein